MFGNGSRLMSARACDASIDKHFGLSMEGLQEMACLKVKLTYMESVH